MNIPATRTRLAALAAAAVLAGCIGPNAVWVPPPPKPAAPASPTPASAAPAPAGAQGSVPAAAVPPAAAARPAAAAPVPGAATSAGSAAPLSDELGLKAAATPVREREGWHPPRVIIVATRLEGVVPSLKPVAGGARFVDAARATPVDFAAADVAIGVCSKQLLEAAPHLAWIQWTAAGVENCVREPLLTAHHVLLTNMQRVYGPSIAEHVLAFMLALSRHFPYYLREQQQAHWDATDPQLETLGGKTVLIAGLGGIGTEVAWRAHALGMRVIATRASGREAPDYVSLVGSPQELPRLAREADYVVNCLPLTAQTTGIFDRGFFAHMKPTAYFVSVGRGRSTVTADLNAALAAGTIAGAGLDVVDPEPLPPDDPLWRQPHVIITPHVSAMTAVSEEQRDALLRENLRRYVAGEPLLSVVDIERGY